MIAFACFLQFFSKILLRMLNLEDWQEIHRSLSILVQNYSHLHDFSPDFYNDLGAAEKQIEKLKNGE